MTTYQLPLAVTNGATIVEDPDAPKRIPRQQRVVLSAMSDGSWWTYEQLQDVARRCGAPASLPGISARVRDLRKMGHTVEREFIGDGVFRYRLIKATRAPLTQSAAATGADGVSAPATTEAR